MKLLDGKTAVITGAARGIGRAIALRFASEGADVAFSDIRIDENCESLEAEIARLGCRGKGYVSDASSFAGSEKLISDIVGDFGRVDILVNNAGITRDNLLLRMSEDDWDIIKIGRAHV